MPQRSDRTDVLRALALRQGGVVTRAQARDLGVSNLVQRNRLANGQWRWRFGCLQICGSPRGDDWRDAWSIALRTGPDVIISGPTAFRLRGKEIASGLVVAVLPHGRNLRIDGVTFVRDNSPRASIPGPAFRLADPIDAFADTLIQASPEVARNLLDHSLQLHQIEPAELMAVVQNRRGRNGVRQLQTLADLAREGTHSHGERELRSVLKHANLRGWIPNYRLIEGGRILAELDFALPHLKICLEVDGRAFHSDPLSFRRDRERQNELVVRGWLVLRFTWEQITKDPQRVVETIRAAIRTRAA